MSNVLSQTFWKDNIIALNRKRWHKTASILRCISDIVLHRAVDCVRSMKADPWQHNGRKITLNNVAKIWQRIIRGVTVHYNVVLPVLQLMAIKRWRNWFNLFQSSIPRTDPRHSAQTMCVHFRLPEYFQVLSGGVHFNPSLRIKMRYVYLQKERLNSGIVICRENGTVWLTQIKLVLTNQLQRYRFYFDSVRISHKLHNRWSAGTGQLPSYDRIMSFS